MKTLRFSIIDTETGETLVGDKNVYISECDHKEKKNIKREPRRCSIVKSVIVDGMEIVNNSMYNNKLSKKEKNNFNKNVNRNDQRKEQKVKINFKDKKKNKNIKLGMSNKDKQKEFNKEEKIIVKVGNQIETKQQEPVINIKEEVKILDENKSKITLEQILYDETTELKESVFTKVQENTELNNAPIVTLNENKEVIEVEASDIVEEPEKTIEEEILDKQPPRKKRRSHKGKYVSPEQLIFENDEVQNQVEELVASQLDSIPGVNLGDVQEQIDSVFNYYDEYEDAPSREKIVKGNKGGDK